MSDVLDDLAEDMCQAIPENKWTELLIYLIEAMEQKAKDRIGFNLMKYGLFEYLSKHVERHLPV